MIWLRKNWFEIVLGIIALIVIGLGFGVILLGAHLGGDENRAQIGDFVGGISTPILTALTFIGVLIGIALQRRELSETRKELELTRLESERSSQALSDQAVSIKIQNFERSFFEQIALLNSVVNAIHYDSGAYEGERYVSGRSAFSTLYFRLSSGTDLKKQTTEEQIAAELDRAKYFDRTTSHLSAFFRTLYNIYRFLDESDFSGIKSYNRILRAQIADYAMPLIFYNSLTERGLKMQRYISKYDMLDNMHNRFYLNEQHADILVNFPTKTAMEKIAATD